MPRNSGVSKVRATAPGSASSGNARGCPGSPVPGPPVALRLSHRTVHSNTRTKATQGAEGGDDSRLRLGYGVGILGGRLRRLLGRLGVGDLGLHVLHVDVAGLLDQRLEGLLR